MRLEPVDHVRLQPDHARALGVGIALDVNAAERVAAPSAAAVAGSSFASAASMATAADPGVVLCVADGIVRIAVGIIRRSGPPVRRD